MLTSIEECPREEEVKPLCIALVRPTTRQFVDGWFFVKFSGESAVHHVFSNFANGDTRPPKLLIVVFKSCAWSTDGYNATGQSPQA